MKRFRSLLVVLIAAAMAASFFGQPTQQPFTITISADRPQIRAGDPVDLTIEMTNTSDHNVDCTKDWWNALDRNYRYEVLDESGQPVPKIEGKHPDTGDTPPCIIKPGETARTPGGRVSILFRF
jgi:hypothetical protein